MPDPDLPARLPLALTLGAAVRPDGTASAALDRRARLAAELYLQGRVGGILCSGGVVANPPSEASLIAAICREQGVPEAALTIEDRSTSTAENMRCARPILDRMGSPPVILVTDAWHLPRARLAARRLGLRLAGSAAPDRRGPKRLRRIAREALALIWYWLTLRR